MSHPFLELTNQELFDLAVKGLQSQNWAISFDEARGYCVYRKELSDGSFLHCALGHIEPNCEEFTIPSEDEFWEALSVDPDDVPKDRVIFLTKLQEVHDFELEYPGEMKEMARDFARRDGLTSELLEV